MNLLLLCVFVVLSSADCARILVSQPSGSKSYQNSFVPLIVALSERGHQVTYVTNYASSDLFDRDNVRQLILGNGIGHGASSLNVFDKVLSNRSSFSVTLEFFQHWFTFPLETMKSVFEDSQVLTMLDKEHFDLVLVSHVFPSSGYVLAWHFRAPFILISPNTLLTGTATLLGDSEHSEYVPFILSSYTDHMNLLQRFKNTLHTWMFMVFNTWHQKQLLEIAHRVIPACPPLEEIEKNVSLVFTNTHPIFSYPRSLPPQVIEVGAIHCRPARPLAPEFEEFVSESEAGFIVFGVGSAIKMSDMPQEIMNSFVEVFSRLPHRVIWQWKEAPNVSLPSNIKTLKWLPQQDLLGHSKCRLFLTHGGLNSLQEAVYHGVPVLGLPMGSDQDLNLAKAEKEGYALRLGWKNITTETLQETLDQLLYNPKYAIMATKMSSLLKDQLETPLERSVFWTEHVLRHGGVQHLQLASRELTSYQRILLDVYTLMVLSVLGPCLLVGLFVKKCFTQNAVRDRVKKTQ